MDNSTWILIAVAAAVAVALIALVAVAMRRRGAPARNEIRRTAAREHRREAELKAAEADLLSAEASLRAALAQQKTAQADVTKAEARREAVLAEDGHHEAEALAREAAETRSEADRIDPDHGHGADQPSEATAGVGTTDGAGTTPTNPSRSTEEP